MDLTYDWDLGMYPVIIWGIPVIILVNLNIL